MAKASAALFAAAMGVSGLMVPGAPRTDLELDDPPVVLARIDLKDLGTEALQIDRFGTLGYMNSYDENSSSVVAETLEAVSAAHSSNDAAPSARLKSTISGESPVLTSTSLYEVTSSNTSLAAANAVGSQSNVNALQPAVTASGVEAILEPFDDAD